MTPLELLAPIAAIVPALSADPLHGVLAPRSSWRKEIVPPPRELRPCTAAKQKVHAILERRGIPIDAPCSSTIVA